jgi:hypothetical protein
VSPEGKEKRVLCVQRVRMGVNCALLAAERERGAEGNRHTLSQAVQVLPR